MKSANVVVRPSDPGLGQQEGIFLHTDQKGDDLPEMLRSALTRAREQWGGGGTAPDSDPSFHLAASIYDEMRDSYGDHPGISTRVPGESEYDLLVLFPGEQRIVRMPKSAFDENGFAAAEKCPSTTFEEYIDSERTWDNSLVAA